MKASTWPFVDYLRQGSDIGFKKVALPAAAAGLSNVMVLALVNQAVAKIGANGDGGTDVQDFLIFLVVIAIYCVAQASLLITATHGVEKMVHRLRCRISAKIAAAELLRLEDDTDVGRGALFGIISRDTETISGAAVGIVIGLQFAILLVFIAIYVAIVDLFAFLFVGTFTLIVGAIQVSRRRQWNKGLHAANDAQNEVFELIRSLIEGLKEVKMSRDRREDLLTHIYEYSEVTRERKAASLSTMTRYFIFATVSFYILLGVIVFVVPELSDAFDQSIFTLATAILFMTPPVQGLAGTIPMIEQANAAAEDIAKVERQLDEFLEPIAEDLADLESFETLGLKKAEYRYLDRDTSTLFHLRPVNLELRHGEIAILSGGNGSGKSTVLKLLSTLYPPSEGAVTVDGKKVSGSQREAVREQITAVFSDYHLFDRLYGLRHVTDERANELLEYLGLGSKTRVKDGRFETLQLSGGQRKRLALYTALLEDRPIMVLDEVAADQDPEFRRRFYKEILPDLKARGKALLVISHDDAYFDSGDRLYKMDEGKLEEIDKDRG